MAILLMIIAGGFVSVANLFLRKSIDLGGTTKGYLIFQMLMSFLVAFSLGPVKTGSYDANMPIAFLGALAGLFLVFLLFFLGRSLECGPAGLTFSALNVSTVMPGALMTLFFGAKMGFPYTPWHAVGSLIVILGLFMAGSGLGEMKEKKKWLMFCFSMFVLHVLLLVLFQFRAMLFNMQSPETIVSFFTSESIKSQWFMPFMFLFGVGVQLIIFSFSERRSPLKQEVGFGLLGGSMNGLCTYFMVWATEVASPLENAVIYPIFSVMTIALSNLWSERLYEEKVNWKACQVCMGGLILGTVDWKTVASFIGLF